MARYRYTAPETTSRNLARIEQVTIDPVRLTVEFIVSLGDDSSGTYVEQERSTFTMESPLPAAVLSVIDSIVTRAFTFLQSRGVIPAGTEEA